MTGFTAAFVSVAALTFAAVSATDYDLLAYPIVVTMWVSYLWMMTSAAVRDYSTPPHTLQRVSRIVFVCGVVALAALFGAVAAGLLLLRAKP